MKKALLFLIILFIAIKPVIAQQRPQYTQYIFDNLLLNPAVTGIENYTDVRVGYRNQWNGLEGAPVTSYITLSAPLGQEFTQGDASAFPCKRRLKPHEPVISRRITRLQSRIMA